MREHPTISDRVTNWAIHGLIRFALSLPYERRLRFMGGVMSRVAAPLMGYPRRIRENLAHVCPELGANEVARIIRASTDNMGRTIAEIYSGQEFIDRCAATEVTGPGLVALEEARAEGRGVVLITGHFGNYDAPRAALIARGFDIAGLYRPMNNALFNEHYVAAMTAIGPAYTRDAKGMTGLVRHLRKGGIAEFLIDQRYFKADTLQFFGKPALTSTVAAELSLRYDAPLVCMYGIRRQDGVSFDLVLESPVPQSDPVTMTQALNDSLEARTRAHMGQWMWSHRRWKT